MRHAGELVGTLCAGIVVGAALAVGSARAASKPPVLPPASLAPKEAVLLGPWQDVQRRANNLLAAGWVVKAGCQGMATSHKYSGAETHVLLVLRESRR